MASLAFVEHRNQDATCYVGNLDQSCTEELLTELFAQVGRVQSVYMPKDKLMGSHNGYGFVEFYEIVDADYAIALMNMIRLFGRPLRVSKSALQDQPVKEIGAKLFVGNLDPNDVNEQLLYDTFSAFGKLMKSDLAKDEATGSSKGYAFVSFDNFQASDTAIECMNGQFLGNRQILVQYALKKDAEGKTTNERHGTRSERMLAEAQQQQGQNPLQNSLSYTSALFGPVNHPTASPMNLPPLPPPPGIVPPPPPASSAERLQFPPPPPPPLQHIPLPTMEMSPPPPPTSSAAILQFPPPPPPLPHIPMSMMEMLPPPQPF